MRPRGIRKPSTLAFLYQDGEGVTKIYKEARRLYGLAAAQVYAGAAEALKELDETTRRATTARQKKTEPNEKRREAGAILLSVCAVRAGAHSLACVLITGNGRSDVL